MDTPDANFADSFVFLADLKMMRMQLFVETPANTGKRAVEQALRKFVLPRLVFTCPPVSSCSAARRGNMAEDREAQEDELLALASIYPHEFQRAQSKPGGEVRVSVELPWDFKVALRTARDLYREYAVSVLPPLVLNFELPADYPSMSSPVFQLNCKWLSPSQLKAVQQHLEKMWQEDQGNVILFSWIQFLKEDLLDILQMQSVLEVSGNEVEKTAEIADEAQGELLSEEADASADLLLELLDFDEAEKQRAFDRQMFSCGVCFSEKIGSDCLQFRDCDHVHCRTCLSEFFAFRIRDGQVRDLHCPQPECSASATPSQVKQLVSEELFLRYDRLLLQSSLDKMEDITYCPRLTCAAPVLLEPDGNIALCPSCAYAFCPLCRRGYHGTAKCKRNNVKRESTDDGTYAQIPQSKEGLEALWEDFSKGSTERKKFLEKRYGKGIFTVKISEHLSSVWLQEKSKDCPVCKTHIQREYGCNRMTCICCHKSFCWDCLTPHRVPSSTVCETRAEYNHKSTACDHQRNFYHPSRTDCGLTATGFDHTGTAGNCGGTKYNHRATRYEQLGVKFIYTAIKYDHRGTKCDQSGTKFNCTDSKCDHTGASFKLTGAKCSHSHVGTRDSSETSNNHTRIKHDRSKSEHDRS
ncbi:E3 ubiquitin-protein ligase RNF14-like isoform X2 [Arapaima gigas]